MARNSYQRRTINRIVQTAQEVRGNGKTWREAHQAAVQAGYKGQTIAGLTHLVNRYAVPNGNGHTTISASSLGEINKVIDRAGTKKAIDILEGVLSTLKKNL
jgi:hypothetical protein